MDPAEEERRQNRLARRRIAARERAQRRREEQRVFNALQWTPDFILRNFLVALSIQTNNVTTMLLETAQMLDSRIDHYSGNPCAVELNRRENLMSQRLTEWTSWQPNRDLLTTTTMELRARRGRLEQPMPSHHQERYNPMADQEVPRAMDLRRTATAVAPEEQQAATSTTIVTPQADEEELTVAVDPLEVKLDPSFGGFDYF